jgi:hypothetical protein
MRHKRGRAFVPGPFSRDHIPHPIALGSFARLSRFSTVADAPLFPVPGRSPPQHLAEPFLA